MPVSVAASTDRVADGARTQRVLGEGGDCDDPGQRSSDLAGARPDQRQDRALGRAVGDLDLPADLVHAQVAQAPSRARAARVSSHSSSGAAARIRMSARMRPFGFSSAA